MSAIKVQQSKRKADTEVNTLLSNVKTFNPKNIIFSDLNVGKIPNSDLTYNRVMISVKNPDGTVGDLVICTPEIYSYGPSPNINLTSKQPDGFKMPLCLFSKSGATEDETQFVDVFNAICDTCKNHVWENKEELELYDLESPVQLNKMNPLYYKKEKGKKVEGAPPTLYAKLIIQKARYNKDKSLKEPEKIVTKFYHMKTGEQLEVQELMEKPCYTKAAIKFESIYFGSGKVILQVKLYECLVRPIMSNQPKRLLSIPEPETELRDDSLTSGSLLQNTLVLDDDEEQGSVIDETEVLTIPEPEPEPTPKKIVRKGAKPKAKTKE
jgi:Protein of unknown function (DUF2738)